MDGGRADDLAVDVFRDTIIRGRFDPAKDAINRRKHGVSLALVEGMDHELALVIEDERFGYDQRRFIAIGPIGEGLFTLAYAEEGDGLRAISLREATKQEARWFRAQW